MARGAVKAGVLIRPPLVRTLGLVRASLGQGLILLPRVGANDREAMSPHEREPLALVGEFILPPVLTMTKWRASLGLGALVALRRLVVMVLGQEDQGTQVSCCTSF